LREFQWWPFTYIRVQVISLIRDKQTGWPHDDTDHCRANPNHTMNAVQNNMAADPNIHGTELPLCDDDDDDDGQINLSMALSPKTTKTRNNKPKQ